MRPTAIIAAATLLTAVPAAATHYIVDTGVGTNSSDAPYLYKTHDYGYYEFQFVAIQFFVPTATTIRSIEGALAARLPAPH